MGEAPRRVYGAWLLWLLALALTIHLTLTRQMDGLVSLWVMEGLAFASGTLSVLLLTRPPYGAHFLIWLPVLLFGMWYCLMSFDMPADYWQTPLKRHVLGWLVGGLGVWVGGRLQRRAN